MLRQAGFIAGLVVAVTCLFAAPSYSGTLWYNGDFDGYNGLLDEINTANDARPYDDFLVDGGGWTVNEVWSNNFINTQALPNVNNITQAAWEIRSGLSAGNGGTVVAGGTGSATHTATGRTFYSYYYEYTFNVSELDVALAPGRYWLAVTPLTGQASYVSYNSTTVGANAVGTPAGDNRNNFFNWVSQGYFFEPCVNVMDPHDYSLGVSGTSGEPPVPEPATMALFGIGSAATAFSRRKKKLA